MWNGWGVNKNRSWHNYEDDIDAEMMPMWSKSDTLADDDPLYEAPPPKRGCPPFSGTKKLLLLLVLFLGVSGLGYFLLFQGRVTSKQHAAKSHNFLPLHGVFHFPKHFHWQKWKKIKAPVGAGAKEKTHSRWSEKPKDAYRSTRDKSSKH